MIISRNTNKCFKLIYLNFRTCSICWKVYATPNNLKLHLATAHTAKKLACDRCDKKFRREDCLTNHINSVHLGIKKFVCEQCDKRYALKIQLKTHIIETHNKIKRYHCHICQKQFTRKMAKDIHVETVHEKLKMFKCHICRRMFGTSSHMKKHQIRIHAYNADDES